MRPDESELLRLELMRIGPARGILGVSGVALVGLAVWATTRGVGGGPPLGSAPVRVPLPLAAPVGGDAGDDGAEDDRAYAFRVPSGEPTSLTCFEARRIVAQVRTGLAYDADPVSTRSFAEGTSDWLDPHGLWALATDAPTMAVVDRAATQLLAEIEGRKGETCNAAHDVGVVLAAWAAELRVAFDKARAGEVTMDPLLAAREPVLKGGTAHGSAKELAIALGRRVGAFERHVGAAGAVYANASRDRFFPPLDADGWAGVVTGAAVRAYVPLVDPHGAWAPFDEEASVYEVELSARPPSRLWQSGEVTAVGYRVTQGVAAPLEEGDVVLSLAGVPTAGLPLEQLEQLGFAASDGASASAARAAPGAHEPTSAVVLRADGALRALDLAAIPESPGAAADRDPLVTDRVRYAEGDALVVTIRDVRDDLGEQLTHAIHRAPGISGVVLDLRGNGGGSTDGAIDALGLFLPGMALFPMKRRDGTVETDRAPEPPKAERWTGPLATLVDGSTASAAEMIAGAIAVYRRGPSIGALTYGKGCAQEYIDDDAHSGVLRMTTLLYALPDGTPVQRVGITPTIRLPFEPHTPGTADSEREATLPHAPPTWRGPDMRSAALPRESLAMVAWPPHAGNVGPCKDADVCRALRALGNGGAKRVSAAAPKAR